MPVRVTQERDLGCRWFAMIAGMSTVRHQAGSRVRSGRRRAWFPRPGIELASRSQAEGTVVARNVPLLDLVGAVAKYARSDKEVITTVAYMVNSGHVRLCGNFKGTRFDLDALAEDVAA
jgi:hypothetical protein